MKSLTTEETRSAAQVLFTATKEARAMERITNQFGEFGAIDAYHVQLQGLKLREQAGAKWIGWKMGLTSRSKREQMSLDSPIFGYLTDELLLKGNTIDTAGMIHPKGEPEIAFRMKKTLRGKADRRSVEAAIGTYCASIEVLDSRYIGFKYFSLPDVIADNCSSGRFFLGEEIPFAPSVDLANKSMKFTVAGEVVGDVAAAEISGDPINSILQLSQMLAEFDLEIPAGAIVLAGAATPAVSLVKGQEFSLEVQGCPPLSFRVAN